MDDKQLSTKIVVVGSANQDYIVRVPTPPGPGETVLATSLLCQPGGKGANQAVAAARLGGNVSFVACVGDDSDGAALLRALRSEGVDTSDVEIMHRGRTGLALISVYDSGENSITVVPGTNYALTAERVRLVIERLAGDADRTVVVVQGEIVPEVIGAVLRAGADCGARCVLNLAPYQPLGNQLLALCDPLVVNEVEASSLVHWAIDDVESARRAAELMTTICPSVVVTIGPQGAYWADAAGGAHVPAEFVDPVVDTTGAGDAFVGALAALLASGAGLAAAVESGVRAGTFAVRTPGAQSSYPTLADLRIQGA